MIKIKVIYTLILFTVTLMIVIFFPNKYTLTLYPLINFIYIWYVYKDEIVNYDYSKYIKSEKFIEQLFWTFFFASNLQVIANIPLKNILHIPAPDISFVYLIVAAPILSVVMMPVVEEVIYRKIIFGQLNKKFNFWISSSISSLLFMFSHYNYSGWAGYLVVGWVWCYAYKKTNNLAVNIITHFIMNLSYFIVFTLKS